MAGSHQDFRDIKTLRDPSGVIAVVTERVSTGQLSFAIMNEFEREGQTQRSAFLKARHIDGALRLLEQLQREFDGWEDEARAKVRAAGG